MEPARCRAGLEHQGAFGGLERLVDLVRLQAGCGETVPGFDKRGPEYGRLAKRVARRLPLPPVLIEMTEVVPGQRIVGVELDRRLVGLDRFEQAGAIPCRRVLEQLAERQIERGADGRTPPVGRRRSERERRT